MGHHHDLGKVETFFSNILHSSEDHAQHHATGYNPAPEHNKHSQTPASGHRIALTTSSPFPYQAVGQPPCYDLDGSPVYFGSAFIEGAVHPCKIAPHLPTPCGVPYGGTEHWHDGRYDLLPFDPSTMELVRASHGHIPHGRRPVEGGYESAGRLYHAIALVDGVRVPGKTGQHLYVSEIVVVNAKTDRPALVLVKGPMWVSPIESMSSGRTTISCRCSEFGSWVLIVNIYNRCWR